LPDAFLAPDNYRAGVYVGSNLPKTPKWQFNLNPRYELSLSSGAAIVLLADYSWTAELWNDTERTYLLKRDAATNLNLSVSYKSTDKTWQTTLGGTNLTDERSLSSGFSQPGTGILSGTYTRGRQWYLTLAYKL
jgi:iron complex outermembrane receptor protein